MTPAALQEVVVDRLDQDPPAQGCPVHRQKTPPGDGRDAPGRAHHLIGGDVQVVLVDEDRSAGRVSGLPRMSRAGYWGSPVRTCQESRARWPREPSRPGPPVEQHAPPVEREDGRLDPLAPHARPVAAAGEPEGAQGGMSGSSCWRRHRSFTRSRSRGPRSGPGIEGEHEGRRRRRRPHPELPAHDGRHGRPARVPAEPERRRPGPR